MMAMAMFDDLFDDFPLHPSLRIPPLQDPFAIPSTASGRLSPLEPNARVDANIDNDTAKLTGRRKALAEAKPIGEPESNDLRPIQVAPRKRRKLYDHERIADFVQLPKPTAKTKDDKLPPFQPISVLNELHEPPPSAALFPPITPNATQVEQDQRLSTGILNGQVQEEEQTSIKRRKTRSGTGDAPPTKRVYLRPRMKWTEEETEQLLKGVAIYGIGKWKKILLHPEFSFQTGRTPVDLKDRFRTRFGPHSSRNNAASAAGFESSATQNAHDRSDGLTETGPSDITPRFLGQHSQSRNNCTRNKRARPNPPPPRAWTEAEDAILINGYQKYGFQWSLIVKDPFLKFSSRTASHIRDRFRLKFPEIYRDVTRAQKTRLAAAKGCGGKDETMTDSKADDESAEARDHGPGSTHDNDFEVENGLPSRHISDTITRQTFSATAPFNIMGLLNDEDEDNRPSSFRYDDWDENVTLPPLLWEDMATRPMFELE